MILTQPLPLRIEAVVAVVAEAGGEAKDAPTAAPKRKAARRS
jgi:hypothetical protein